MISVNLVLRPGQKCVECLQSALGDLFPDLFLDLCWMCDLLQGYHANNFTEPQLFVKDKAKL